MYKYFLIKPQSIESDKFCTLISWNVTEKLINTNPVITTCKELDTKCETTNHKLKIVTCNNENYTEITTQLTEHNYNQLYNSSKFSSIEKRVSKHLTLDSNIIFFIDSYKTKDSCILIAKFVCRSKKELDIIQSLSFIDKDITNSYTHIISNIYQPNNSEHDSYWENICKIQQQQTQKGLQKYGQVLEQNKSLTKQERIRHLQEELIDALMYTEHLLTELKDE